jgi:hypothetical protein
MFNQIFSYHRVMPVFIEFLLVFGFKSLPQDLRFSGFKSQILLGPQLELDISDLNRSGRQFQICYNLKCVNRTRTDSKDMRQDEWSIR